MASATHPLPQTQPARVPPGLLLRVPILRRLRRGQSGKRRLFPSPAPAWYVQNPFPRRDRAPDGAARTPSPPFRSTSPKSGLPAAPESAAVSAPSALATSGPVRAKANDLAG